LFIESFIRSLIPEFSKNILKLMRPAETVVFLLLQTTETRSYLQSEDRQSGFFDKII